MDSPNPHHLNSDQLFALKITSLVGGSLSSASVLAASYWFVRMRRSFRHDLIMLLLQSDMLKATWFMIYPIVELSHGPTPSNSPFCQVSGFFLTVGIEACDIAAMLMAIHTALCILRREKPNGLQSYRPIAYAFFVGFPLLLASLAFINDPGFTNSGEYCYLPLHPDWARRSLSWIPRYIIFVTILITYAFVYIHVALLINRYGVQSGQGARRGEGAAGQRRHARVPPLPRICTYGLVPSILSSRRPSAESKRRRSSMFSSFLSHSGGSRRESGTSATLLSGPKRSVQVIKWKLPRFGLDSAQESTPEGASPAYSSTQPVIWETHSSGDTPISPMENPVLANREPSQPGSVIVSKQWETTATASSARSRGFWNKSIAVATTTLRRSRSPSLWNIFAVLRRGPHSSSSRTTSSIFLSPTVVEGAGMAAKRDNILRQTGYLFIYPLVYLGVWLIPFISHLMGGDNAGAPFGIILTGLLSLTIQGFADALVSLIREKPWKESETDAETGRQLWHWNNDRPSQSQAPNIGRSREDMIADRRHARWRLDEELAEKRLERLAGHRTRLDWWETEQRRVLMSVDSTSDDSRSHLGHEGTNLPGKEMS